MCYGTCPEYSVKIDNTGQVLYNGVSYVEKVGIFEWVIDEKIIKKLNDSIIKYDYFKLKKKPGVIFCTDMPYCITQIELESGKKRKINHYLQDYDEWPVELRKFEEKIDKLVGIKY